jgi:hypothetical protein
VEIEAVQTEKAMAPRQMRKPHPRKSKQHPGSNIQSANAGESKGLRNTMKVTISDSHFLMGHEDLLIHFQTILIKPSERTLP